MFERAFTMSVLITIISGAAASGAALASAPPDQWYTGSLFSPSGAVSHAGDLAIEPYFQGNTAIGNYDSNGRLRNASKSSPGISNFTLIKYGLTDRLSIYTLPTFSYGVGNGTATSGIKMNDLPFELHYRFLDADPSRFRPALNLYLGFTAPTGDYDNLTRSQDGVGAGAWLLRFGLLSQSTYRIFDQHALRIRLWAVARVPLATVALKGLSAYGTSAGFSGRAREGAFGNAGTSIEFGINQRWVLAADVYRSWSNGSTVSGAALSGTEPYDARSGASGTWNVAPALEYSWSPNAGIIAGVVVPVSGHNASRVLSPEIGVNLAF